MFNVFNRKYPSCDFFLSCYTLLIVYPSTHETCQNNSKDGHNSCSSWRPEIRENAGNQGSMAGNHLQVSQGKYIFSERTDLHLSVNIYFARLICNMSGSTDFPHFPGSPAVNWSRYHSPFIYIKWEELVFPMKKLGNNAKIPGEI